MGWISAPRRTRHQAVVQEAYDVLDISGAELGFYDDDMLIERLTSEVRTLKYDLECRESGLLGLSREINRLKKIIRGHTGGKEDGY